MLTILNSVRMQKAKVTKNWNSESQHSAQQISSCSFQAPERMSRMQNAKSRFQSSRNLYWLGQRWDGQNSICRIGRIQDPEFRLQIANAKPSGKTTQNSPRQISDFRFQCFPWGQPTSKPDFRIQNSIMSWNSPLQNSVELQQIHNSDFRIQCHL